MSVVLQDPCRDKKVLTSKSPLVHQKRVHFHISEKWAWETKKQNFVFKDLRTLRFPNMQETIKEFSESFNDWSKVARKSRILWHAGNNSFCRWILKFIRLRGESTIYWFGVRIRRFDWTCSIWSKGSNSGALTVKCFTKVLKFPSVSFKIHFFIETGWSEQRFKIWKSDAVISG